MSYALAYDDTHVFSKWCGMQASKLDRDGTRRVPWSCSDLRRATSATAT